MRRIALWGSYSEGNFGDDLMALLLAEACKSTGASVVAYRTPPLFESRYGIERAESLDDLLAGADLCVVGGGEFLFRRALIKYLARRYLRRFENSCAELAHHAERRSVPLAAFSVGGDGTTEFRHLSRQRRALFGSPMLRYASVRLRSDLATLSGTGARIDHFPDVLLATAELVHATQAPRQKRAAARVALNVHRLLGIRLVQQLRNRLVQGREVELVIVRSHLAGSGHDYELSARDVGGGVEEHHYRDPRETAGFLATCDVVVSSKLHVGVVAMSYGGAFVSVSGKPKAREFMTSVGNPHVYSGADAVRIPGVVARLLDPSCAPHESGRLAAPDVRCAALNHIHALETFVRA